MRDLDTDQMRKGVQLVALSDRVANYRGRIAVRRLSEPGLAASDHARLWQLRKDLRGRQYEADRLELIKAAYDGPLGMNEEDLSSLFCSELVAEAYQCLGLLGPSKPSNEYVPADFSSERKLELLRGELLPEVDVRA